MKVMVDVSAFHYSALRVFNDRYYEGLLTHGNCKEEIAIGRDENQRMFWVLEKNKRKYVIDSEYYDALPVKIKTTEPITYKGKVYHHLTEILSVKYKAEKKFTFRELIDNFAPFKHSNPIDFLLYKIMAITAYISRINIRVSSNPSFGKDSIFSILHALRNDTPIINPHSTASIDYRLNSSVLVLTELSNLNKEQRRLLQEFLLVAGDMKNIYEKPTRGSSGYGTQDTYDISRLSIVINYNRLKDYKNTSQDSEFFDNVFQPAVRDRYCPFKLDGKLDISQFTKLINPYKVVDKYFDFYRDIIHTLEYFKRTFDKEDIRYDLPESIKVKGRHLTSFSTIARAISFYAEDEAEFVKLVTELYNRYKDYLKMIGEEVGILDSYANTQPVTTDIETGFSVAPAEAKKFLKYYEGYPRDYLIELFCERFDVGKKIAERYVDEYEVIG